MTFYTYVLYSKLHERFYTGLTQNLKRRLQEHNSGKTKSTKAYRPWELVFSESFQTRAEARNREKYLKSGVGREYIRGYWTRSTTE